MLLIKFEDNWFDNIQEEVEYILIVIERCTTDNAQQTMHNDGRKPGNSNGSQEYTKET